MGAKRRHSSPVNKVWKRLSPRHNHGLATKFRWAILTGEYPPQPGGVADYTRLVAAGLAAAGDAVTVYAPPSVGAPIFDPGVTVHTLPDHFGACGLLALDRALSAAPRPDRILIQYVPHAYGCRAMNLPFAAWVGFRARQVAPVWVMFHEVMYPLQAGQPWRHAILGRVTRAMARQLARVADRVFVSIPAWGRWLCRIAPSARPAEWLPVPSVIPHDPAASRVAAVHRHHADGAELIGHFGTYGGLVAPLLEPAVEIGRAHV